MDFVRLGRTGLRVSVIGLGGGGHSRLGLSTGATEAESVALVGRALDLGVNFLDTAEAYGTERIVGLGVRGRREDAIISTKKTIFKDERRITPQELKQGLDASLQLLGVERVEIYHLHAVKDADYDYAREHLVPALHELQTAGKIGFLGLTEQFAPDPGHIMMQRAVRDRCWDVVMVGFNILNQSARERVFPLTLEHEMGVLNMFAVRQALSQPETLRTTVEALIVEGKVAADAIDDREAPLDFLVREGLAESVTQAAYRFCRQEPGIHVVLSGTGNPAHLEENVKSLLQPPLPQTTRTRLMELFQGVDNVSGQMGPRINTGQ